MSGPSLACAISLTETGPPMWQVVRPDARRWSENTVLVARELAPAGLRSSPILLNKAWGRYAAQREQAPSPHVRCSSLSDWHYGLPAIAPRQSMHGLADPPPSWASPLPHLDLRQAWKLSPPPTPCGSGLGLTDPQHNLPNMLPTFHPRMGLGRLGVIEHLVNHRQAAPG